MLEAASNGRWAVAFRSKSMLNYGASELANVRSVCPGLSYGMPDVANPIVGMFFIVQLRPL